MFIGNYLENLTKFPQACTSFVQCVQWGRKQVSKSGKLRIGGGYLDGTDRLAEDILTRVPDTVVVIERAARGMAYQQSQRQLKDVLTDLISCNLS
jgi:hypothetical protein